MGPCRDQGRDGGEVVKIRIPVVVASDGAYSAYRWSLLDEADDAKTVIRSALIFHNGKATNLVWIEADVPLTVETVVEGKVVS